MTKKKISEKQMGFLKQSVESNAHHRMRYET